MILIADSGSTKTDWCLLDQSANNSKFFKTKGINPQVQSLSWISNMLLKEIPATVQQLKLTYIYYYGAGCSSEHNNYMVEQALNNTFTVNVIAVNHDIMGAVRASCNREPGIACILGTGSNSIYFDGKKLIKKSDALGYILGDEGSGAYIGKKLVADFLYGRLPKELMIYYKDELQLSKEIIFQNVYTLSNPNRYLAAMCGSLEPFRNLPYVINLIESSFEEFFRLHVLIYKESKKVPIHFIGSIAYFHQETLERICKKHQLQLGNFIQSPIVPLCDYHQNNEYA